MLQKFERDTDLYRITPLEPLEDKMVKLEYFGGPNWEMEYKDNPINICITIEQLIRISSKEQAYLAVFDRG